MPPVAVVFRPRPSTAPGWAPQGADGRTERAGRCPRGRRAGGVGTGRAACSRGDGAGWTASAERPARSRCAARTAGPGGRARRPCGRRSARRAGTAVIRGRAAGPHSAVVILAGRGRRTRVAEAGACPVCSAPTPRPAPLPPTPRGLLRAGPGGGAGPVPRECRSGGRGRGAGSAGVPVRGGRVDRWSGRAGRGPAGTGATVAALPVTRRPWASPRGGGGHAPRRSPYEAAGPGAETPRTAVPRWTSPQGRPSEARASSHDLIPPHAADVTASPNGFRPFAGSMTAEPVK